MAFEGKGGGRITRPSTRPVSSRGRSISSLPKEMVERWRRVYEETPFSKLPWHSPRPYRWVRRAVRDGWLPPGGRTLDVGCGTGSNALLLSRSGYRVSGIDLSPRAIEISTKRLQNAGLVADLRVGDALRLPFPRSGFDAANDVGCFHTLPERLRRPYARELSRVLRPQGRYLLSWVAREYRGTCGPAHRLSLGDVTASFEREFMFLRTEFTPGGKEGLPAYSALLERRARPQPASR